MMSSRNDSNTETAGVIVITPMVFFVLLQECNSVNNDKIKNWYVIATRTALETLKLYAYMIIYLYYYFSLKKNIFFYPNDCIHVR